MGKRENERATLQQLAPEQWDDYLAAHSALPGPRGNLELLSAVAEVADAERIRRYAASDDEYQAACGAAGLGRLLVEGDSSAAGRLRLLASDRRWRVREGVAMALQRLGDDDPDALWRLAEEWVDGPPLVQRAVAAGVCEPRLLRTREAAHRALGLLDRITVSFAGVDRTLRRAEGYRVLRQGLGYCWSVAAAALPAEGFAALERWAEVPDADVQWIVHSNLGKARLARADPEGTARVAAAHERTRAALQQ